jgi:hypothetical protein
MENVLELPIATYTLAMRIAVKYLMDDVQVAITKVIRIPPQPRQNLHTEISLLAFVAEFPSYFSKGFAIQVFTKASSISLHPTANDLGPLIAHPAFLALMMQYREGLGNPDGAIWKGPCCPMRRQKEWLDDQFKLFGFKP